MNTFRSLALAAGLALGFSAPTLAGDFLPQDFDENGNLLTAGTPYLGKTQNIIRNPGYERFRFGMRKTHRIMVEAIPLSDFPTASGAEDGPSKILDRWEPGYWQDDDGYFRKLF